MFSFAFLRMELYSSRILAKKVSSVFYSLIKYWLELDVDLNYDIYSFDSLRPGPSRRDSALVLGI